MTISTVSYHLNHSYIHNWLVSGPESILVPGISSFAKENLEMDILKHYYTPESGVTEEPVDVGPLTLIDGKPGPFQWRYYSCLDDHFIDFSTTSTRCTYQRAWAFTLLEVPQECSATFTLTTNGPVDFWLNNKHVNRQERFNNQSTGSASFQATLSSGLNQLLFRFETVAIRETSFVMALKLEGLVEEESNIIIPTNIEKEYIDQRVVFEKIIQKGYLQKYVYGWFEGDKYDKNEPITVRFSKDLQVRPPLPLAYRLESLNGDIFQEGNKPTDASIVYELARNYPLRNGPHQLELVPETALYYVKKIQLQRRDLFYVVRTPYSNHLYSMIHERRREAIEEAAKRRGNSIYTEIAKMVMGQWEKIDQRVLQQTFENIDQRHDGSIVNLLGLIGVLLHFRRKPEFPKELRGEIETRILSYRYWEDEPGDDIMDFCTESRQLLFHTCEVLAGQLFQDKVFSNTTQPGRWHREKGERLATAWMTERGMTGWQDWDSPVGFEEELAALSFLVDFATSASVVDLASIMMDKILFTMALNSFQGSYGTTHGRAETADLISSRLEATSGITRMMWGMGNFNEHLLGTVCLALSKKYEFPNLIKNIAIRPQEGLWDREHHGIASKEGSPRTSSHEVNKVTYKTTDYVLSSAQNYQAYDKSKTEHLWQATLGPDAVVFVNHPACMSQNDAHKPNLWNGNASMPSVAQWGDVLVSRYNLPDDDWLGFTHAYFPTAAFDEFSIESEWAFARKDKGYIALYSKVGFEMVTEGQTAWRELRAIGNQNIWMCHMGQELLDGSFENFQKKIHALNLSTDGDAIRLTGLRGEEIAFGPESHLLVNGQEQSISGLRHYESPYCIADFPAQEMVISYDDQGLRLTFTEE